MRTWQFRAAIAVMACGLLIWSAAPTFAARIRGTDQSDVLKGTPSPDEVWALKGADVVWTYRGGDVAYGNQGADRIALGRGDDEALGGEGADLIFGGPGEDTILGEGSWDHEAQSGLHDVAFGGSGSDWLQATAMKGQAGADDIWLWSMVENQRARGGPGDDTIRFFDYRRQPTSDRDVVRCGRGFDRVVYHGEQGPDPEDVLMDCEKVVDRSS